MMAFSKWERINIQRPREMSKKYNNEMNLSPAFYQVVYGALQKACFMEIAKLYDKTKDVVSVGLLLKYCRDNLDL